MLGLVFAAGLYTLAAVEDMLHEANEAVEDSRWSAVSFLVGFTPAGAVPPGGRAAMERAGEAGSQQGGSH